MPFTCAGPNYYKKRKLQCLYLNSLKKEKKKHHRTPIFLAHFNLSGMLLISTARYRPTIYWFTFFDLPELDYEVWICSNLSDYVIILPEFVRLCDYIARLRGSFILVFIQSKSWCVVHQFEIMSQEYLVGSNPLDNLTSLKANSWKLVDLVENDKFVLLKDI